MALTALQKIRRQKHLYSWTSALLLIGIILILNFIVSYFPLRLDTSEGGAYSLSKGSKLLLKDLDDTLLIRIMFSSNLPPQFKVNEQYVRDLLAEYKRAAHGKIRIENFDPGVDQKSKQEAMAAGVMPVQVDVRERDRREVKESFMGLSLLYGDKKESLPFIQDAQGLEYEITQRIKKLIKPGESKIGIISNGKALTFASDSLKALAEPLNQLYTAVDVDLTKDVPADLKSLWLLGPSEMLDSTSTLKLKNWVAEGGTLGLLVDQFAVDVQSFRPTPLNAGLDSLLREWGLEVNHSLVLDQRADRIQIRSTQGFFQMINLIDYPYFPLVIDVNRDHPATKLINGFSLPFVSPIYVSSGIAGAKYTILAKSSEASWLDPQGFNVSPLQKYMPPADAVKGPFDLAVLAEFPSVSSSSGTASSKMGRVILIGCSRFIRTDYPPKETNYGLFFNLLDWSVQDEFLLSIRAKGAVRRTVRQMSDGVRLLVKWSLILTLPVLSIILGLVVWSHFKRRRTMMPLYYKDLT